MWRFCEESEGGDGPRRGFGASRALGSAGGGTTVTDRLLTFHTEAHTELSTGLRLTVTKDCARMFVDKPLLVSVWNVPTAYPPYQSFYTNIFVNERITTMRSCW